MQPRVEPPRCDERRDLCDGSAVRRNYEPKRRTGRDERGDVTQDGWLPSIAMAAEGVAGVRKGIENKRRADREGIRADHAKAMTRREKQDE